MDTPTNHRSSPIVPLPVRYDYYLHSAATWTFILSKIIENNRATIYDLCCGWSPKIELALTQTDFQGKLFAIDRSQTALSAHKQFSTVIAPEFTISYRTHNILSSTSINIPKADIILCNHILDDLIFNVYCERNNLDGQKLFARPETLRPVWTSIMKNPHLIESVFHKTCDFLSNHVAKHGKILLTHYVGYQENLFGYPQNVNDYRHLLGRFKNILLQSGTYTDRSNIVSNIVRRLSNPYFSHNEIIRVDST